MKPYKCHYSNEQMIAELRRVAVTYDRPMSRPMYQAGKGRISAAAITSRFGSWLKAINAAELPAAYRYGGTLAICPICAAPFRDPNPNGDPDHRRKTCGKPECRSELQSRSHIKGNDVTKQAARGRAKRVARSTVCVRCGATERVERHHRDRNPYNNAPDNLEVLCVDCHRAEHRHDSRTSNR